MPEQKLKLSVIHFIVLCINSAGLILQYLAEISKCVTISITVCVLQIHSKGILKSLFQIFGFNFCILAIVDFRFLLFLFNRKNL